MILDEAQDTSKLQFSFINLIVFGKRDINENDIKELDKINKKIKLKTCCVLHVFMIYLTKYINQRTQNEEKTQFNRNLCRR